MIWRRLLTLLFGTAICLVANAAGAVAYKATLHEPTSGFAGSSAGGIAGVRQVGTGLKAASDGHSHALLWGAAADNFVDLHPSGASLSVLTGIAGNTEVGWGRLTGSDIHALMWSGTSDSVVDLNPTTFEQSEAYGVSSDLRVGAGSNDSRFVNSHALLWKGSAHSVVDLTPPGCVDCYAFGVSGDSQVGYGSGTFSKFNEHALMWAGTAASVVDLNPGGNYDSSEATGAWGDSQVGFAHNVISGYHAVMSNGSAASVTDLNPAGFTSAAYGVCGNCQVGIGDSNVGHTHALLWYGTANCYIDLHSVLTDLPVTIVDSFAKGIDAYGDIVGHGLDAQSNSYALLWTPVSSPGDFSGDGKVDAADYTLWRDSLGLTVPAGTLADASGNGIVDQSDYDIWKAHFMSGAGSNSSEPVPEPSSWALLCCGAFGAVIFVRCRRERG
jgi:hypothetical protein